MRLEPVAQIAAIRPEWEALADAAGNPFLTFEWCSAWWRHRARGELRLWLVRDGDRPAAVLPLFEHRRRLRFLGHGDADVVGPVCAPADRPLAVAALREALGSARILDALYLPGGAQWAEWLGGAVVHRESCPVLRIGGRSWDEILAGRSANFRSQVRRRRRALDAAHAVTIRRSETQEELDRDLDVLMALHDERFGRTSTAFAGSRAAVHREWAAAALARGWLRLWTVELDGAPAAALYVFRFGGVDWFYQSGRAARFERDRVGFVLLAHAIADACEAGQEAFSLLLGDEAYKARFADDDPGLEHVIAGHRGLLTLRRLVYALRRAT